MTRKEQFMLITLSLMIFVHVTDLMAIVPLGNYLVNDFELSPKQYTYIISAYKFSAAGFGLLGTLLIDRFERRKVLLLVYIVFVAGLGFAASATTYESVIIARSITGVVGSLAPALIISMIGDAIPFERRAKALGFLFTGMAAAAIAGVPFSLFLADAFNWRSAFGFMASLSLVAIILAYFGLPAASQVQESKEPPIKVIKEILLNNNPRNALFLSVLLYLASFTILIFLPSYLVRNVGFDQEEVKYVYLASGVANIVLSPFIGYLSDKFGKRKVLFILIGLFCIPALLTTHFLSSSFLPMILTTGFFYVLVNGRMVPANAIITATVSHKYRGGLLSLISSTQQMLSGVISLLAGLIILENEQGGLVNYTILGYIAVFTSLVAFIALKMIKPSQLNV